MKNNIVTICGSMRFKSEMMRVAYDLEIKEGFCVLQCVYETIEPSSTEKEILAKLHYQKIDISDAIYVLNIGGYIGSSTQQEITYAQQHGKKVYYHEPIPNNQ